MIRVTRCYSSPAAAALKSQSRATERELVVMVPAVLLRVRARLRFSAAVRSRAARSDHVEPGVLQRVERLLDEGVFEIEASRVAVGRAAIRVAAFVQRVAEHLATDGHAPADEDARDLPELDVGQAVSAELEGAAVADEDEAGLGAVRSAGRRQAEPGAVGRQRRAAAELLQHPAEAVELGLVAEATALAERLGEDELAAAQVVEDKAKESAVAVDEVAALGVTRRRRLVAVGTAEPLGED